MREYANVWPQAGLFAFSGVDGATRHAEPFVASGTAEGIGWQFWLPAGDGGYKPAAVIRAYSDARLLTAQQEDDDFCLSDCWSCTTETGTLKGAFLDRSSLLIVADSGDGSAAELVLTPSEKKNGDAQLTSCNGCWLALVSSPPAGRRRFAIAMSYTSVDEAIGRAHAALEQDFEAVLRARLRHYDAVRPPSGIFGAMGRAYSKALSVQKVNIEAPQQDFETAWTTPDRMPHRHMWLWDTCFHALGLQHINMDLAEAAIDALLAKQRDDGKLLLAVQPGEGGRLEDDTQPPIVAWTAWQMYRHGERVAFLQRIYPKLVRYLEWFEANRKRDNGLYGWSVRAGDDPVSGARGGESGMDNSPRFDRLESLTAIDLSCYMAAEYGAMDRIAQCLWKSEEASEWHLRHQAIVGGVNGLLWDLEDRFYYDLDAAGEFVPVKTTAGLMALHGRVADRDHAEALRMHITSDKEFWTLMPLASVSRDERQFSKDMWRGPAWPNVNLLLYEALCVYGFHEEARALAHRTLDTITRWYEQTGCFYEYYDALDETPPAELPRKGAPGTAGGVGFGVVPDLHWTAATFIHLANQVHGMG